MDTPRVTVVKRWRRAGTTMDPDEDAASSAEPNASVDASLRNVATTASRVIPSICNTLFSPCPSFATLGFLEWKRMD